MEISKVRAYDVDDYVTEVYDQTETQTEDVRLLRELIGASARLRILEPFCGNGRILIPLAEDGHEIVGLDISATMLDSARRKIRDLPEAVQQRVTLLQVDVTTEEWPGDLDLVVLGGNCFYELATAREQEGRIRQARAALKPNGRLYLDNNHMEGDLDPEWQKDLGVLHENRFPTGTCADGTEVKGTTETIWFHAGERLVRFRRTVEITTPDGSATKKEWVEQKHPPSTQEMRAWLETHGFAIEHLWGDRRKSAYTDASGRAIFWAQRQK